MPTPTKHKHAHKRNAKPKHAPRRYRNAGPPAPRPALAKKPPEPPPTLKQKLIHLAETVLGAGATSVVGAYSVKWGANPMYTSVVLGGLGGLLAAIPKDELTRNAGSGAASAAASQLLLLKLNPAPAAHPAPPPPPPPPPQLPRPKNVDLGTLPPGMLDAAFERARAELAVAGDGYPSGYEASHHHFHHGPVMP